LKKTGSFRKSGGNPRKPQNRQGNPSGKKQNQNSGARKGGLHPWVSSSASSSQALTSHLTSTSKNRSGGTSNRKPQNPRNPSRPNRNNDSNANGQGGGKTPYRERPDRANGRTSPSRQPVDAAVKNPPVSEKPLTGGLEPFNLFCAYHLGIGPKKEYRPSNLNEVARRFGQEPATVRQALKECGMDSAALLDRDFDMALAQLDIQVAPEGIDRMELAKSIYEDFQASPHVKRDWNKILENDRKENRKVFG
jgi:hypothetical protein